MYGLKLTGFAETEPFSHSEQFCVKSEDGQIMVTVFNEKDESYSYDFFYYFVGIYVIGENEIYKKKIQFSSGKLSDS